MGAHTKQLLILPRNIKRCRRGGVGLSHEGKLSLSDGGELKKKDPERERGDIK